MDQIFAIGDRSGSGSVSADAAYKIFTGSQLPPDILTSIWEIANVEENSTFGKHCVGVALRLVGHAQIGQTIKEELVNQGESVRDSIPELERLSLTRMCVMQLVPLLHLRD